MKHDFLYVAGKADSGTGDGGFIRLAVPLKEVNDTANLLRMKIIFVVSIGLVVTVLISTWLIMMVKNLVAQIAEFSRSLAMGELGKRLFLQGGSEFGAIAGDLTTLSERLRTVVAGNEEEKNRLQVILKSIPDALLIIDASGTVRLSNEAAAEFFGPANFTGMQFMEVVRSHEFCDLMDEVRAGTQSGRAEFSIDTPSVRVLSVTVSPLFFRGETPSGFVAVFHDVTQARRLEEVRKDFVANVSHELKTPITAIKGFSDTLLDGAIDDREHALKFLKTIKANSERINSLVDDLMTISKIELGVIRVEKTAVPIDDVLEHVSATLGAKAAEKDLTLSFSASPGLDEILADRDRLIQIFTNLVDNAIKFTDAGSVVFGIAAEDGKTFLFVEDTGPGIPQKHLPRLGERFYRIDAARSRKMGGTGLGLAIVKHLVRAHGWEMQIESTLGKGTRVRISLTP
jgi:two-component system phosphate regulon sensor histidine kinase PhoR